MKKRYLLALLIIPCIFMYNNCTGIPKGVTPVKNVDTDKYLGKWYEIARFDHKFERGLSKVTAEYSMMDDGGIKVVNRGYKAKENEWSEADGKAYLIGDEGEGHLKVSFFGPFYSSYVVFGLDEKDYQWSYVTGYNKNYLWFLSRTPTVTPEQKERFIQKAKALGYDTDKLIFVEQ